MPKKRTAAEANNDEETNEGSDPVFQQEEDNAKRVKLTPLSDKTLQDLPIQLLKRILVKTVAIEVKDMKLAKRVWKEKADLVISRLKDVSLHWSNIVTTYAFLTEVHRILDGTAQETIRLEILLQSRTPCHFVKVTAMKEEIFMLCNGDFEEDGYIVEVYDRNNMAEVKDVIELPGTCVEDLEVCRVSNCIYVLSLEFESNKLCYSVLCIKKEEEHKFKVLPWISGLRYPVSSISVLPNGVLCVPHGQNPVVMNHYDANGSLMLSADIHGFKNVDRVIQRSNRNLVLAAMTYRWQRVFTEIDTNGKIQRQYISPNGNMSTVHSAGMYGRIMIHKPVTGEIELLDSELNPLDFDGLQRSQFNRLLTWHSNIERNEITYFAEHRNFCVVTTFRFTEEE